MRWQVSLGAILTLTSLGLVFAQPLLLVAAIVPLLFVLFETASSLPESPALAAERRFDPAVADPGEPITVTLRIENQSETVLPDVRVTDRLPDVAVISGTPRVATALAPGERVEIEYRILGRRGDHEFDDPLVRLRPLAAGNPTTVAVPVAGDSTLVCRPLGARRHTRDRTQHAPHGGTEFYATRQYRRGDPMRQIDWRHVAKTGEFVTVQYRADQPTPTALVVDVRPSGRVSPGPHHPSSATLAVDVAERLRTTLDGNLAGLGAVGVSPEMRGGESSDVVWAESSPRGPDPQPLLWQLRELVTGGPAESSHSQQSSGASVQPVSAPSPTVETTRAVGGGESADTGTLFQHLTPDARIVLCTPALDDWPVRFGQMATARGHDLVVISPRMLTAATGAKLAAIERHERLRQLDRIATTVDWSPGEPIRIDGVTR